MVHVVVECFVVVFVQVGGVDIDGLDLVFGLDVEYVVRVVS